MKQSNCFVNVFLPNSDKIAVKQAQQEFILTRKQEEEDYSYAKALELEEATRQENMNVAKAMEILQKVRKYRTFLKSIVEHLKIIWLKIIFMFSLIGIF